MKSRRTALRPTENAAAPQGLLGRRERKAAATRLRLYRCAVDLFARRGIENVSIEDITEAADVGKGTFFNYFAGKEHVLAMIADLQLAKLREAALAAVQASTPAAPSFRSLAKLFAHDAGRNPRLARAALAAFSGPPAASESLRHSFDATRKAIARLAAQGLSRKEIDPRLQPDRIAAHFLQSLLGTTLLWSLYEKPRLATAVEPAFESFWRSVAPPPAKRKKQPLRKR